METHEYHTQTQPLCNIHPNTQGSTRKVTYILTPGGGSHTHSPVVRLAYICSLVRGSIISTHSHLKREKEKAITHVCKLQNNYNQNETIKAVL